MKTTEFNEWPSHLPRLTRPQLDELRQRLDQPRATGEAVSLLESGRTDSCPDCRGRRLYRWGRQSELQRYRCRDCGRAFNALSATPLARLRHKGRWLGYGQALAGGLTVREAARRCHAHKDTSFRWRHRFMRIPAESRPARLRGVVEGDETYFPLSYKGQRRLPRPAHRRGGASHQRGTGGEKAPVLVMRDRHGATADFKLAKADVAGESPLVRDKVARDAVFCSDGGASLQLSVRAAGIEHRALNLSAGIRVAGAYHIQNVNAYCSRLKWWMGRFHGVATKYLQNYLGWRRWLDHLGNNATPQSAVLSAVGLGKHFQLLTQT